MYSGRIPALWILDHFVPWHKNLSFVLNIWEQKFSITFLYSLLIWVLCLGTTVWCWFLCQVLMSFPLPKWQGCSRPPAWNCTCVVGMRGCLTPWDFLIASLLYPVSDPCRSGMDGWSERRHHICWPDLELSGWASQIQRDQMGRQTEIAPYPPPAWKCRRATPEVQGGLIWSPKTALTLNRTLSRDPGVSSRPIAFYRHQLHLHVLRPISQISNN